MLYEGTFTGARHAAQNAGPQRDAPAYNVSGRSRFGLHFDFFGAVVEQADANVIETEILLNLSDDLAQHVHRIVARYGSARDVVQECELPGAALLIGKQSSILHGDRYLPRRRCQYVEIALLKNKFAVGIHRDHNPGGFIAHENRHRDQALRRAPRKMADAKIRSGCLQFGADQQGFAGSNHVLAKSISKFTSALGQNAIIPDFKFKVEFVSLLKCDVKVAGVKNLAQLDLNGAKDFVLVETRTDRLPDLGQQLVLFCTAMGVVTDHVVFEGEAQLQGKSNH